MNPRIKCRNCRFAIIKDKDFVTCHECSAVAYCDVNESEEYDEKEGPIPVRSYQCLGLFPLIRSDSFCRAFRPEGIWGLAPFFWFWNIIIDLRYKHESPREGGNQVQKENAKTLQKSW